MATSKFSHFRPLQKCISNNGLSSSQGLEASLPRAFSHVPKGTTYLQKSRFLKNIIFYFISYLPLQRGFFVRPCALLIFSLWIYLPYFSDYKTHPHPQIGEESGVHLIV